jgi:hypothetical protein
MSEIQAEVEFEEISDLYKSYMPFLKSGGLFVTTEKNALNGYVGHAKCHLTRRPCVRADRRYCGMGKPSR